MKQEPTGDGSQALLKCLIELLKRLPARDLQTVYIMARELAA